MRIPPSLPLEFAAVPFSVAEARASGVSASRLRRSDLSTPFRGVRTALPPSTHVELCFAYAPRLRAGQVFSHISAAALWGMWLPERCEREATVHVLAVHPADRPRAAGVQGHRGSSPALSLARGLPVTDPSETWVQLAATLSRLELVMAGDSLIRRQGAVATLGDLHHIVELRASSRGLAAIRGAEPLLREGTDSAQETRLRLLLRRARLPDPEVNGKIVTSSGESTFGDIVFREWKVLGEYDGIQHRTSARQFERDVLRLEGLAADGWTVVRVLATQFADERAIVERVVRALRDHGWRGRPSRGQLVRGD